MKLGLISDTHGLFREKARMALRGCALIVHAGDVGKPEILETLRALAPVVVVRGNIDMGAWAESLPFTAAAELDGGRIFVIHDIHNLQIDPAAEGFRLVVSGHSHKSASMMKDGVLYVSPGAAGPRRFHLPVTVGIVETGRTPWEMELVDVG